MSAKLGKPSTSNDIGKVEIKLSMMGGFDDVSFLVALLVADYARAGASPRWYL